MLELFKHTHTHIQTINTLKHTHTQQTIPFNGIIYVCCVKNKPTVIVCLKLQSNAFVSNGGYEVLEVASRTLLSLYASLVPFTVQYFVYISFTARRVINNSALLHVCTFCFEYMSLGA